MLCIFKRSLGLSRVQPRRGDPRAETEIARRRIREREGEGAVEAVQEEFYSNLSSSQWSGLASSELKSFFLQQVNNVIGTIHLSALQRCVEALRFFLIRV